MKLGTLLIVTFAAGAIITNVTPRPAAEATVAAVAPCTASVDARPVANTRGLSPLVPTGFADNHVHIVDTSAR